MIVPDTFNLPTWKRDFPNAVFIIDEAEQMFETHMLDLRVDSFQGLAGMRACKIWFFTATLSDYWRKIVAIVFSLQEEDIMQFPTAKFLRDGFDWDQRIVVSIRTDKAKAIASMCNEIKTQITQ